MRCNPPGHDDAPTLFAHALHTLMISLVYTISHGVRSVVITWVRACDALLVWYAMHCWCAMAWCGEGGRSLPAVSSKQCPHRKLHLILLVMVGHHHVQEDRRSSP